jgi:hypothetical protein
MISVKFFLTVGIAIGVDSLALEATRQVVNGPDRALTLRQHIPRSLQKPKLSDLARLDHAALQLATVIDG